MVRKCPFASVADIEEGRSFSSIKRINRNRTIQVTADADKEKANLQIIQEDIIRFMPDIVRDYPGMQFTLEGEAREQQESFGSVWMGSLFVLFTIYSLLAIPFRSYMQPLIVMSVIPFGLGGAILGHIIMGQNLSIMSVFGMLALSGVVVNDSLVLVDYINRKRREGTPARCGANGRCGPLQSHHAHLLYHFCRADSHHVGKSTQAQFLIPMAISLGWGILFATFITLLMVPINYLLLEDGVLAREKIPSLAIQPFHPRARFTRSPTKLSSPSQFLTKVSTMPLLHIQTNLSLTAKQTSDTLKTLSSQVANWLEKSENFVQIILQPQQPMTFAGTEQPTAHIRWESLGFGQRSFEELSQLLCRLIQQCLGIPSERIFIRFCEVARSQWGWDGHTF